MATDNRGFAPMEEQQRKDIASKGEQSQGEENNPGNFTNDNQKAKNGGQSS